MYIPLICAFFTYLRYIVSVVHSIILCLFLRQIFDKPLKRIKCVAQMFYGTAKIGQVLELHSNVQRGEDEN